MLKFRKRTLACAAAVAAAGCAAAGLAVSPASASTSRPAVVTGLSVKAGSVTTDGVTLTWNREFRADGYRVVVVNASTPAAGPVYDNHWVSGTSVKISSLTPGRAYEARVEAEGQHGGSAWSGWVLFYTDAAGGTGGSVSTTTTTLVNPASAPVKVATGGSFSAGKTALGTVALGAGTWQLSLNVMATPDVATPGVTVYPQAFIYNGTPATDFSNDLFNIGAGALAPYNAPDPINSYYSGTSTITVPAGGETLNVYAFGYDSDTGAGSYVINDATLTATELTAGS